MSDTAFATLEQQEKRGESMEEFVANCRYEAEERPFSCCVDGRDLGDNAPAARPGADAGDFLAALAALRSLEVKELEGMRPSVLEAAVRAVGGPEFFRFHTDEHAQHDLKGAPEEKSVARGCGHLRLAEKEPEAYGLEAEDMEAVFQELLALRKNGATEVILSGEHGEKAVVVVESPKSGLRHKDDGMQAFVYHQGLDHQHLEALAKELSAIDGLSAIGGEKILAALQDASTRQRQATLERLAKGKPIFVLKEDGSVVPAGNV